MLRSTHSYTEILWSLFLPKSYFPRMLNRQVNDPFCCPSCGKEYPRGARRRKEYHQWCTVCDRQKLVEKFGSWTSGNEVLDQFIQHTQLEATWYTTYVEWAEPGEFENITHLADGGFGSIYKANWSKGWRYLQTPAKSLATLFSPIIQHQFFESQPTKHT